MSSKSVSQVMSPGYPTSYATNLDCEYRIVGPVGHYLVFSFDSFDLSRTYNCSGDSVRIEEVNARGAGNANLEKNPPLQKICFSLLIIRNMFFYSG